MKILQNHPGIAIAFNGQLISFSELLLQASAYEQMIRPHQPEKVMICAENSPEWIFAFYGAWKLGAIVVPADVMSTASELKFMIEDCRPEVIFCSASKQEIVQTAIQTLSDTPHVFILDECKFSSKDAEPEEIEIKHTGKTSVIIYTSGTTGSPKGVMLSFDNLLANIDAVSKNIPIYSSKETVMILLPLHHIFPLVGSMVAPLYVGGKVAMSPSLQSDDIIRTLQQNMVSIIIGVPRLYAMIRKGVMDKVRANKIANLLFSVARKLNSRTFSKKVFNTVHQKFGGHIKYMVCGGAPLDEEVAMDYKTLGFEMLEGFGMTEAAPMISFTRPGHWKIGAAGQVMPGVRAEIRDGEIVASGKNIMMGYYNRPDETSDIVKDGWLYTGDLGEIDKDGYIRITGRKKEIIVLSNGKNINPNLLETMMMEQIEGILETGIILNDDKLHAIIRHDQDFLARKGITDPVSYFRRELTDHFNKEVSTYKNINAFTLIDKELPRTRLGKIQRFKLQELLIKPGSAGQQSKESGFEEYHMIRTYLMEQKSVSVSPDDHLEFDLGLDSLDKVGLQTWLEKSFGVSLKVEHLMNFPTVMKLAEYVREKKSKFHFEKINWSDILKEKINMKYPGSWYLSQFMLKVSKYIFKVYFRMKYQGLENIPETSCIIAPNHQSILDGFIVASLLRRTTFSKTYFYAKEKHIRPQWLKYLATQNNIIIVDLNNDLRLSIQKMAMVLQNNRNIIIFPEGTRTHDGNVGQFKDTYAILSRELNVPVVPVVINGAWKALPRGSWFPRPFRQITVNFLKVVTPEQHSYQSLNQTVRDEIQSRLAS